MVEATPLVTDPPRKTPPGRSAPITPNTSPERSLDRDLLQRQTAIKRWI
ncbi:MAG: hypothetical protein ACK55Z_32420 [bacterium]